ncbi:ChaB family protein [Rhodococcoides corynebacterioides]|uniref:ChaB family protein n=1 Tax=Rhodococcoides corynebacterioides TaxID=53972 RepID=A0ABS7P2W7_9NOCA|nr:ChaB family protein [Rhodococcus corynebacterioides]MBY6365526.1 ChaB family protein [Rhodococcus corynebacterioides]MBY6408618.1 ChaB family protein [Rhodococcus corynebacterioides]
MPATDDHGDAKSSELPSTLQKSDEKAQRTYAKALDSAEEQYDDESRAHRVAYAALKHTHEKVGDHWEEKDDYGPSDERAESGGPNPSGESKEGVDANATKDHLEDVAKKLDITGRSRMTKDELVDAIEKENRRRTDRNR